MRKLIIFFCFSVGFHSLIAKAKFSEKIDKKTAKAYFLENKGQVMDTDGKPVPSVLFKVESLGLNIFITETGITYVFLKSEEENEGKEYKKKGLQNSHTDSPVKAYEWNRVEMCLRGSTIKRENIIKAGESANFKQYFLSHCPSGISGVREYEKITITNVYPGIDWVLYNSNEKGFKYDFVVHPGANPKDIQLIYSSKLPIKINSLGEIEIRSALGSATEHNPVSFLNGKEIATKFASVYQNKIQINGDKGYETCITFIFPNCDISNLNSDLIIDPQLTWATLYGGNGLDGAMSTTTDLTGNVYTTGYTNSLNFPTSNSGGFFQGSASGNADIFIMKYSTLGILIWSTYYGGNALETSNSIKTDAVGNVFITGWTESLNFPVQNSGTFFSGTYSGGRDAFVIKFNSSASRLWATFYGGSGSDEGNSVSIDVNGNIFIAGVTSSANFPLLNSGGYFQNTISNSDAYILKFTNAGTRLWATFYGGGSYDHAFSTETDTNGNVFVVGITLSNNFPVQNSGTFFQGSNAGSRDLFILKFSNTGVRLWATYYGGSSYEGDFSFSEGNASVASDSFGNIFITGTTNSTNFPVLNSGGFFQSTNSGSEDAYILKFDNLGNRLWASYYGGLSFEYNFTNDNICIDKCNNVFISFSTNSNNLVTQSYLGSYFDGTANGSDGFLAMFDNNGTLLWATYFGGQGNMSIREALATDTSGNLYITGEWKGANLPSFPFTNPGGGAYFHNTAFGNDDSFIARFLTLCNCSATAVAITSCTPSGPTTSLSLTTTSGFVSNPSYNWVGPNSFTSALQTPTALGASLGIYTVTVNWAGCTAISTVQAFPPSLFAPIITNTPVTCFGYTNGQAIVSSIVGNSSAPYTYSWVVSPTQTTSLATNLSAGNHVCLVTDSKGCTYSGTTVINQPPPLPVAIISDKLSSCIGQPFNLAGFGASSYSWSPNIALSNTLGTTCVASPTITQTYTVLGAQNTCTGVATITLTVGPPPAILTQVDHSTICAGGVSRINANGANGYTWSPANSVSNPYSNFIIVQPPNNTTYTLQASSDYCTVTKTISIEVIPYPTLQITASDQKICNGNSTSINASGAMFYTWMPLTHGYLIQPNTLYTAPISSTNYTLVGYNTINSVSCSVTKELLIEVIPKVTAAVIKDVAICEGEGVKLNSHGGNTYVWNPVDGLNNSLIQDPFAKPKTTTIYSVFISNSGYCGQTATVTVKVNPNPTVNAGEDKAYNADDTMHLNATGAGTLTWLYDEGIHCRSCPNTQISPKRNTCFFIEAVNQYGCKSTDDVCIDVTFLDNIYIPNSFTPNEDGLNDSFKIYGSGITIVKITIYDRWGHKLYESNDTTYEWDGTFKGEQCKNDIYTYTLSYVGLNGKTCYRSGHVSLIK